MQRGEGAVRFSWIAASSLSAIFAHLPGYHELAVLRHQLTDPDTGDIIPCRLIFAFSSADKKVCQVQRERIVAKIRAGLERIAQLVARGQASYTDPVLIQRRAAKLLNSEGIFRAFRVCPLLKEATPLGCVVHPVQLSSRQRKILNRLVFPTPAQIRRRPRYPPQ